MNSNTPRTDAAEYGPGKGGISGSCSADFARQLELECDKYRETLEDLRRNAIALGNNGTVEWITKTLNKYDQC